MDNLLLLIIICYTALSCYSLERRVAWIAYVSAVCMIILSAFALAAFGFIPVEHAVYDVFLSDTVPIAIVFMVLGLNLSDVTKIPKALLVLFAAGALGTMIGAYLAGILAYAEIGPDAYKLAAQLSASYVGGGENAVAMQKMYNIPNESFVAIFAVDNLVTSLWVVITIIIAKNSTSQIENLQEKSQFFDGTHINILDILVSISLGFSIVLCSELAAKYIGRFHEVLYLSFFALVIGQIPIIRNNVKSAYMLGSVLFSGFFFSIGAISDIEKVIALTPITIAMPFIVVFIHAIFLFIAAKLMRIGSIDMAVVSQALIGGPATAVAIAHTRGWKVGISAGIILGILGYSVGTFGGATVFRLLAISGG